jgi:7-cyano-7-deazaguanine synthase in queuosine biosynthesis
MKFRSGPAAFLGQASADVAEILLFGQSGAPDVSSAGAAVKQRIKQRKLVPSAVAWDLLSVALSVVAADGAVRRSRSPDGWTRQLDLHIATSNPDLWSAQASALTQALGFLTTDVWQLGFSSGAEYLEPPKKPTYPEADAVGLLSGGLDSLIGAIDLTARGHKMLAVSQTVRGDSFSQRHFAKVIGGGLEQLQVNHNASTPRNLKETSQRSRSLIFLAFAALAATTLERYKDGETVPLYICENGFIAINPPLTTARLGSLSTRTAHPDFLARMQSIFSNLGLRVEIKNPYIEKTKGEMLNDCVDQSLLRLEASASTSCGRFQRFNYRHCGRCIPCQIRRAAFHAWDFDDATEYVYEDLGKADGHHAEFDDIRSVAMALASVEQDGLDRWLGTSLSSPRILNRSALRDMTQRGLSELRALHLKYGV